jgi:transposase
MRKYIMVGCDVHDERILVKVAEDRGKAETLMIENTISGRKTMFRELKRSSREAGGAEVVMAYEASCQGFGLYDEAVAAGCECHVLAPTKIARSVQHRRRKTDERDADRILDLLRGHLLAGNELPAVWVPDIQTREDREIVRARLDVSEKAASVKTQVRTLLKRNGVQKPSHLPKCWSKTFEAWLRGLTAPSGSLTYGARVALASLLRQKEALEEEIARLDQEVEALSETVRYAEPARAMMAEKGVGLLTAIVFLTEMGDLNRFENRKQVGAYVGLVPSSDESGEGERKGHITHLGPWRVRRALCQATWARMRTDPAEAIVYERLTRKNPKHRKIAVVALMRRLAVRLWHIGRETQDSRAFSGVQGSEVAA